MKLWPVVLALVVAGTTVLSSIHYRQRAEIVRIEERLQQLSNARDAHQIVLGSIANYIGGLQEAGKLPKAGK